MDITTEQIDELLADEGVTQAVFSSEEEADFFCNYISSKGYRYETDKLTTRKGTEIIHYWKIHYWKEA